MTLLPSFQNQGQAIALGWNVSPLKNWTAYLGTDGEPFLPPNDRNGFSEGVERRMGTGVVLTAGFPISRQTFPWMSYGQIDFLQSTFSGQNVTVSVHVPYSLNKEDTVIYNAVCNIDLNQTQSLQRTRNGYEGVVVEFVLVEPL